MSEPVSYTPLLNAWREAMAVLTVHGHKMPLGVLIDKESGDKLLTEYRSKLQSWQRDASDWRNSLPNAFGMNELWIDSVCFRWPAQ